MPSLRERVGRCWMAAGVGAVATVWRATTAGARLAALSLRLVASVSSAEHQTRAEDGGCRTDPRHVDSVGGFDNGRDRSGRPADATAPLSVCSRCRRRGRIEDSTRPEVCATASTRCGRVIRWPPHARIRRAKRERCIEGVRRPELVPSEGDWQLDRDACLPTGVGAPVTFGNCPARHRLGGSDGGAHRALRRRAAQHSQRRQRRHRLRLPRTAATAAWARSTST
jgi:hypothetical protein